MKDIFEHAVKSELQERLPGGKARCNTCCRRCVIEEGRTGWCGTRMVRNGRLYTLTYGQVSSIAVNPIEKKPFYHFYPGSYALTSGSWGCNFACPWCQNWRISKAASGDGQFMLPKKFVEEVDRSGCHGISVSFNEPTLSLEWSLEAIHTARRQRNVLYSTFVTNGYMTSEALKLLVKAGLSAMNVDIKGDAEVYTKYCEADIEKVWETCSLAQDLGLHLEITTLIIPGMNDKEEQLRYIASRIVSELGKDVPWHVSAYFPAYHFEAPPTPISALDCAQDIGHDVGLNFVYIGNIDGHGGETRCPSCGTVLAVRAGLSLLRCEVTSDGECPNCATAIPGVGWNWTATH